MKKLIARVKTKSDQIVIMSPTPIGEVGKIQAEITKVLQELVAEEKVAAADITKLAYYRGEPFAWAWLANEGHPAYMGHIMMAEMMAPLLTEQHRSDPE
jgi:lysophospholipase L1-like esterase